MYSPSTISKTPSILKKYDPGSKSSLRKSIANQVRFDTPKLDIPKILGEVIHNNRLKEFEKLLFKLNNNMTNDELFEIIEGSRNAISLLKPILTTYVEALVNVNWLKCDIKVQNSYKSFVVELLISHNSYTKIVYSKLISYLIPDDDATDNWLLGCPSPELTEEYDVLLDLFSTILEVVPMSCEILVDEIKRKFPYFRKPPHVVAGYVYNLLYFSRKNPLYLDDILEIILNKLLILDINAPRDEIEEAITSEEEILANMLNDSENFTSTATDDMTHLLARTLDYCMNHIFNFINEKVQQDTKSEKKKYRAETYKILMAIFEKIILTTHNSHHIQFFIFYLCSLNITYTENFVQTLWRNFRQPNTAPSIKHALISYLASFLARGKFISISMIKEMLNQFCIWAHEYIQRCEGSNYNHSLLAHKIFYAVCQSIFYIIAFRSKDLVSCKKGIRFLESLQLSSLVTSNLNPLRVCLPTIATAFSSITRIYQLVYCHPILERNARRQLTTIYKNDSQKPEDCLETYFPFDPYLLKISGAKIAEIYLQYESNGIEEEFREVQTAKRKRMISISNEDEFITDETESDSKKRHMNEFNDKQ